MLHVKANSSLTLNEQLDYHSSLEGSFYLRRTATDTCPALYTCNMELMAPDTGKANLHKSK